MRKDTFGGVIKKSKPLIADRRIDLKNFNFDKPTESKPEKNGDQYSISFGNKISLLKDKDGKLYGGLSVINPKVLDQMPFKGKDLAVVYDSVIKNVFDKS